MTQYPRARRLAGAVLSVLATAAVLHSAPVRAEPTAAKTTSVAVQIERSALQTDEGVARVYTQLRTAARAACGESELSDVQDIDLRIRFHTCVNQAVARAVADVHDAGLSAYHAHRTGAPQRLLASSPAERRTP